MLPETRNDLNDALSAFDEPARLQLATATERAIELHAQQSRRPSGEAYSNHVVRVAARIVNEFRIVDSALFIAALFHDAVEDQRDLLCGHADATREEALAHLAGAYSPRVSAAVAGVTNTEAYEVEKDITVRNQLYASHVIEACDANKDAFIVKLSDFFDNAMQLQGNKQPGGAQKGALKYGPLFDYFIERLTTRRPENIAEDVANRLIAQIQKQQEYVHSL